MSMTHAHRTLFAGMLISQLRQGRGAVDSSDNLRAGCIVIFLPALFTSSPEVISTMRTFLPFMCTALVIHTASMATEGMLLAGAPS